MSELRLVMHCTAGQSRASCQAYASTDAYSPAASAVLCIVCQPAATTGKGFLENLQLQGVLFHLAGLVLCNLVAHLLQEGQSWSTAATVSRKQHANMAHSSQGPVWQRSLLKWMVGIAHARAARR